MKIEDGRTNLSLMLCLAAIGLVGSLLCADSVDKIQTLDGAQRNRLQAIISGLSTNAVDPNALTNVTGSAGVTVSGTGRTRAVSGAQLVLKAGDTMSGALTITGSADVVQLTITPKPGQTANLAIFNSSYFNAGGYAFLNGAQMAVPGNAFFDFNGTAYTMYGSGGAAAPANKFLATAANNVPGWVVGYAGQTTNLWEFRDSSGNVLSYIDSSGSGHFPSNSVWIGNLRLSSDSLTNFLVSPTKLKVGDQNGSSSELCLFVDGNNARVSGCTNGVPNSANLMLDGGGSGLFLNYNNAQPIFSYGTHTFQYGIVGNDATESTSPTTGAIKTLGGVGIAKNLNVGGTANFAQAITNSASLVGTNTTSFLYWHGLFAPRMLPSGASPTPTGSGMEVGTSGGKMFIIAYNRTSPAYLPFFFDFQDLTINNGSGGPVTFGGVVTNSSHHVVSGNQTVAGTFNQVPLSFSLPINTINGNSNWMTFAHGTVPSGKTVTINYVQSLLDNGNAPGVDQLVRIYDATGASTLLATNGNWNGTVTITSGLRWYVRFENNSTTNINVSASIHGNIK